jgi:hypothetical protein
MTCYLSSHQHLNTYKQIIYAETEKKKSNGGECAQKCMPTNGGPRTVNLKGSPFYKLSGMDGTVW